MSQGIIMPFSETFPNWSKVHRSSLFGGTEARPYRLTVFTVPGGTGEMHTTLGNVWLGCTTSESSMTWFSVSIGSSATFGVGTRCRFLRRHVVGVCYEVCLPYLPLYPLYWRIAPTQGRQRTMCSTAALDGIDRNQLSAESWCFLGDIAVVSINPIDVVASTPA